MPKSSMLFVAVVLFSVVVAIICLYVFYYHRWKHLWALDVGILPKYEIKQNVDTSLRVAMIGDSWAGIHHEHQMDAYLSAVLEQQIGRPVLVESKGKGGEKTRGIYKLMFETGEFGTKNLLASGPDYCIISAGINDAAANLGTEQYCYYYRKILDFLLANGVRPVVLEIPNVNLWHLYGGKPLKDLAVDFVKSTMTRCRMYQFDGYREALYQMLVNEGLIDKVIYVSMNDWDDVSPDIDKNLFMSDQIHLNRQGYERLDSCIAIAIARDLENPGKSDSVY